MLYQCKSTNTDAQQPQAAAAAAAEVAGGGSAAAAHLAPPQSLTPFQNTLPKPQAAAAAAAAATAAGGDSAAAAHSVPAALPVNISDGRRQFLTISTDADLYAQSHTNLNAEAHTQARDANSGFFLSPLPPSLLTSRTHTHSHPSLSGISRPLYSRDVTQAHTISLSHSLSHSLCLHPLPHTCSGGVCTGGPCQR